jgi:hypothetical protein
LLQNLLQNQDLRLIHHGGKLQVGGYRVKRREERKKKEEGRERTEGRRECESLCIELTKPQRNNHLASLYRNKRHKVLII